MKKSQLKFYKRLVEDMEEAIACGQRADIDNSSIMAYISGWMNVSYPELGKVLEEIYMISKKNEY